MSTTVKKVSSVLLSVVLLLSCVSSLFAFTAQAASGSCGPGLSWDYNEKKATLTISGSGAMNDFDVNEDNYTTYDMFGDKIEIPRTTAPWQAHAGAIKSVVIQSGVTKIGAYAFAGCTSLENVAIDDSVAYIGDYAFGGCVSLKSFTIPDSVKETGFAVFYQCFNLTDVTIGNGLTRLSEYMFYQAANLKNVAIGSSVKAIGAGAFMMCFNLERIVLPNSVKSIDEDAFMMCVSLKEAKLGSGVTSIGEEAFGLCLSLEQIAIPNGTAKICDNTFSGCFSLRSVVIPASVTTIGEFAFCIEIYDDDDIAGMRAEYNMAVAAGKPTINGVPLSVVKAVLDHPNGCLTDVYYTGSESQWRSITIESYNGDLRNAHLHYNAVSVTLNNNDITMNARQTVSLNTVIHAARGASYTVKYESSNPKVVKVNDRGEVTSGKRGTATVTCTVIDAQGNAISDSCNVTVNYTTLQWILVIFLFGWLWF